MDKLTKCSNYLVLSLPCERVGGHFHFNHSFKSALCPSNMSASGALLGWHKMLLGVSHYKHHL